MAIAVQCELMSAFMDLSHQLWILLNALSNQKECCADFVFCQSVQHLRCIAWMRTVVKGQGDYGQCPHEIRHWDDEPAMCDKGGVFSCAENLSLEFHRGEQHLEDVTAGIRPLVLVRSDVGHSQAEDDEVFAGRYYERFARDGSVRENS